MKKTKLLSLFLTAALVLTTVFASTEAIFASSVTSGSQTYTEITAQNVNKITDAATIKYTASMTTGTDNTAVIPVNVSKAGTICVPLNGVAVGKGVTVTLHSASTASDGNKIGYSKYLSSSSTQNTLNVKVTKAGTYYLKFETSKYSAGEAQSVEFNCLFYPAGGTLTKGKIYYGVSGDNNKVSYYKVTASGNGYLTVSFPKRENDYSSYYVKLTNSKKKALFNGFENLYSSKGYTTRIGVTKGTYYIAVKNSDNAYGIKATFTSVKESSGSTRSKAKSIYKGGTKKGIITAAQSSTSGDWYKFKITKTQKVKFSISTLTSAGGSYGGLKFSFYQAGKSYAGFTQSFSYSQPSGTIQPYSVYSTKKLSPGTYYIKVQKNSDGSGYYKMKWL